MSKLISRDEMLSCSLIGKYPFKDVEDVIREACIHQADADDEVIDDITHLIKGSGIVTTGKVYHIKGSQLSQLIKEWQQSGLRSLTPHNHKGR